MYNASPSPAIGKPNSGSSSLPIHHPTVQKAPILSQKPLPRPDPPQCPPKPPPPPKREEAPSSSCSNTPPPPPPKLHHPPQRPPESNFINRLLESLHLGDLDSGDLLLLGLLFFLWHQKADEELLIALGLLLIL